MNKKSAWEDFQLGIICGWEDMSYEIQSRNDPESQETVFVEIPFIQQQFYAQFMDWT